MNTRENHSSTEVLWLTDIHRCCSTVGSNRKAAPIARSDGSHGDSDSSDSEEELDSPLHIHQSMPAPSSTSTAMEVDNSDSG